MHHFTTISFPGLGLEMNPGYSLNFLGLSFRLYGLMIGIGMMLAVLYAYKHAKRFGHNFSDIVDGVLFIVPFAILGARLYYCVFEWDQYKHNPISIFYIWEGGLAIYGGVIFAALGVLVYSKWKKVKIGAVMDITALGFLIGQSCGRWGNFFNREAFGAETDSFLRMGLLDNATGVTTYYHPTFLYESLWNVAGFVLLHYLSKKRKFDGQIALGYVAWYGLGRALIEGLRTDSLYWGAFRVSQVLAAASCLIAVAVMIVMALRKPDPANLCVNRMAALAEEAEEEEPEESEEETEESTEGPAEETSEEEQ